MSEATYDVDRIDAWLFVQSLLRVQEAQKACAMASVLCQDRDYEKVHFALKDELVALWPIAADLGIDMRVIEDALGSGGVR